MTWTVLTVVDFDKAFGKLDRPMQIRIGQALEQLAGTDDPTKACKALSGPLTGLWRHRVGNWRIILDVQRHELVILALDLGNRATIYDR
ncbi:MAG: type II toxin-antitoxin system RelE/ParE family toxin [Micrococcales bacterium]|nr:type II toxin-antitoxin system RelE/ParE family toxin [Micrococcales bacterium]